MNSPDLLGATAELVAIASVSHEERAIADLVQARLARAGHLRLRRTGNNIVASTELGLPRRVVLAGHLDTVPPTVGEDPGSVVIDGDRLVGLGAADMKGGLAVMLWLAETLKHPAVDLTFVFYACEEVEARFSGLSTVFAEMADVTHASAAILLEPTGAVVEAGCQGTLRLGITLAGRRAHTARPWMGRNAIHRLGPLLQGIGGFSAREPVIDGCQFREALQAVGVSGGVAANVVPDSVELTLNHRFAPDRDLSGAQAALLELIGPFLEPTDQVRVLDSAPSAPPSLSLEIFGSLVETSGAPPRAKLGWTDVARFASVGVPAVNFGPGEPTVAHTAGEWVSREQLDVVGATLAKLLGG